MKALFIDTSDTDSLVALLKDEKTVAKFTLADLPLKERDPQINKRIKAMLEKANVKFADLEAYAVVTGPGSWTGVRIGVTVIKAYALAIPKPIIAIRQNPEHTHPFAEIIKEVNEKFKKGEFTELDKLEPFYDGEFKVTPKKKRESNETN